MTRREFACKIIINCDPLERGSEKGLKSVKYDLIYKIRDHQEKNL